jgi:hypothetical protein
MSDAQKILTTTEKVNKILGNVPLKNVFHVVFVAPMLAYIGYLAVNNKPITFGKSLIYLAVGMAVFHLYIIVNQFMNEFNAEFGVAPSTTATPSTTSSASSASSTSTSTSSTTATITTEVPISFLTTETNSQTSSTTILEDY